MRTAIVGSGALGLYYGALLQKSGEDVHFLLRSDYEAIRERGLKIFSTGGDFFLPRVSGYRDPHEIGPVELVIVGLKTFANPRLAELIAPLVGPATLILTLQNGLGNEELLAGLFGGERIIGGVAFLCATRGIPGEVHHQGTSRIVLGELQQLDRTRIEGLAGMFVRAGVECRVTDDLKKARWEKLVWNIPFNGLCSLLQQPVDRLLSRQEMRRLVAELMGEVIAAANAQGLSRPIADSYVEQMLQFTDRMGSYRPSMQVDRELGRQLELESIFALPLAYGSREGIAMPRVNMLATLLEQATA